MKQLQNNFTTPEQSKKLLELGLPADSADCYYLREHTDKVYLFQNQKESDNCISKIRLRLGLGHAMPCWSVGRLIEIYVIARGVDTTYFLIERDEDIVKYLIRLYEEKAKDMDFSKLEE